MQYIGVGLCLVPLAVLLVALWRRERRIELLEAKLVSQHFDHQERMARSQAAWVERFEKLLDRAQAPNPSWFAERWPSPQQQTTRDPDEDPDMPGRWSHDDTGLISTFIPQTDDDRVSAS